MVTNFFRLHKDIINIVLELIMEHIMENVNHHTLVNGTSILKTAQHDNVRKIAIKAEK